MAKEVKKMVANNKKAFFDYFIEDKYEAGISLAGTEVKSLRMGKCSIKEAFIRIEKGEVYVYNMHISPYEKGNIFNKDPLRVKKLLLHRYEIRKIEGQIAQKGYTVVPLNVYFKGSLVKVEIGLAVVPTPDLNVGKIKGRLCVLLFCRFFQDFVKGVCGFLFHIFCIMYISIKCSLYG